MQPHDLQYILLLRMIDTTYHVSSTTPATLLSCISIDSDPLGIAPGRHHESRQRIKSCGDFEIGARP